MCSPPIYSAGSTLVSGSELSAAIRLCRNARGLSARRLSLNAGLSESVVGKIESGAMEPGLRVFAKLVEALDLSPLEIVLLVKCAGHDQ